MSRKYILSDESVNSYGFRVLTEGIDIETRYAANPVILYMHETNLMSVGRMQVQVADGKLTGVPEWDTDDPIGRELARKYEKGYMNAFSIGIEAVTLSDEPALLLPGQTRYTVTRSLLYEISVANIPSNANAVRLMSGDESSVPHITNPDNKMKRIALVFGLAETATEDEVLAAIAEKDKKINTLEADLTAMREEQNRQKMAELTAMLENPRKAFTAGQKEELLALAATDLPRAMKLAALQPEAAKLHTVPGGTTTDPYAGKSFKQLQKEAPAHLAHLKKTDFNAFVALYKAEFGTEPKAN
jgi:hypothetical protein